MIRMTSFPHNSFDIDVSIAALYRCAFQLPLMCACQWMAGLFGCVTASLVVGGQVGASLSLSAVFTLLKEWIQNYHSMGIPTTIMFHPSRTPASTDYMHEVVTQLLRQLMNLERYRDTELLAGTLFGVNFIVHPYWPHFVFAQMLHCHGWQFHNVIHVRHQRVVSMNVLAITHVWS